MLERIKQVAFLLALLPIRLTHAYFCDNPECLEYYEKIGRGI